MARHGISIGAKTDLIASSLVGLKRPIQNLQLHREPARYQSLKPCAIVSPRAPLICRRLAIVGRLAIAKIEACCRPACSPCSKGLGLAGWLIPAAFGRILISAHGWARRWRSGGRSAPPVISHPVRKSQSMGRSPTGTTLAGATKLATPLQLKVSRDYRSQESSPQFEQRRALPPKPARCRGRLPGSRCLLGQRRQALPARPGCPGWPAALSWGQRPANTRRSSRFPARASCSRRCLQGWIAPALIQVNQR